MTVGVAFEKYHENAVVPHLTVTAVTSPFTIFATDFSLRPYRRCSR